MNTYAGLDVGLAGIALFALAAVLALYYAAACAAYEALESRNALWTGCVFAASWLLAEMARGTWFTGFGWGAVAYAHVGTLARAAKYAGAYGMSALTALDVARKRLGSNGHRVTWIAGDICDVNLPEHKYDIWHDRAVFHFLIDPAHRAAYARQVMKAVEPGGHMIVATFAPDGPEQCSGLPVARYAPGQLHGVGIPIDRDRSFRPIVTDDSGLS